MKFRFYVFIILFLPVELISLHEANRQTIERVRKYLQVSNTRQARINTEWLENSNKIGFGYNILAASPICYTGQCQMDEFTHSVFKLEYTSAVVGSCINKLVPNNVELDCLPSTEYTAKSEIIDTVEQLHTSISNKVSVSLGAKLKGVEFSYKYSKETKRMTDNIVKNNQVSIFTTLQTSLSKLSMFEPKMELSDNFRYVVENLICCDENDPDVHDYIKEFIFEYFGLGYVTSVLLGGIAQQNIFMSRESKERLEQQSINIEHQASIAFDLSMGTNISNSARVGISVSDSQSQSKYNSFINATKLTYRTTLGGDAHLLNFADWSKTVEKNPVIVKSTVRDIFRLFTKLRFPNDPLIANKSKLIEKSLEKYINGSIYCMGSCGNENNRGTCEPIGYFQLGICKCNPGWTGVNCEIQVIEKPTILQGTICGFDRSIIQVNCGGFRPWEKCPDGWLQKIWLTDLTVCYKSITSVDTPVYGTICGVHSYSRDFNYDINIGCGGVYDIRANDCPTSFQKRTGNTNVYTKRNVVCAATNIKDNLPGTLCGMQIEDSVNGPSCDGYDPGLRRCPPGYTAHRTAFDGYGFMVCVKN